MRVALHARCSESVSTVLAVAHLRHCLIMILSASVIALYTVNSPIRPSRPRSTLPASDYTRKWYNLRCTPWCALIRTFLNRSDHGIPLPALCYCRHSEIAVVFANGVDISAVVDVRRSIGSL